MKHQRWLVAASLLVVAGLGAACGSAPPPTPLLPPLPTVSSTAGSPAAITTAAGSTAPSQPLPARWQTSEQKLAPKYGQTELLAITTGHHTEEGGFDRVTFEFLGPEPGYDVRYVVGVVNDPKGDTMPLAGQAYLQVTLLGAVAHSDDPKVVTPPRQGSPNLPQLRAFVINGDFEGQVNVALGLGHKAGFRVGVVPGQTHARIYVDVQN